MKKVLFLAAILLNSYSNAEMLDLSIEIDGKVTNYSTSLDNISEFSFLNEKMHFEAEVKAKDENALELTTKIYEEGQEGNLILLAEPTLIAEWNQSAEVVISDESSSCHIVVKALPTKE